MTVSGMPAYLDRLTQWIADKVSEAGAKGVALGISGGIDSAVALGLCMKACPGGTLGIIMPCQSQEEDMIDAYLVMDAFRATRKEIDLSFAFRVLLNTIGAVEGPREMAEANLKPRLRMLTLYFHANVMNYLVVGTTNRSELKVGYFTKHGDGGVDLLPLANMVKHHVKEAAMVLGVPRRIIDKPPSAGLWPGQTDEEEMGLTYDVLDRYVLGGDIPLDSVETIEAMARRSAHKFSGPLRPDFYP